MRRLSLLVFLLLSAGLAACEDGTDVLVIDESGSVYLVETNADEGDGSLRAALEAANTDPLVNTIQVGSGIGTVSLASSLIYTGAQPLRILGNGVVVDGGGCACDLLTVSGGADLDLFDLTLRNGENGLRAVIPSGQTGTVEVRLVGVTVEDNGLHGVQLDDGTSSAGIHLELISAQIRDNGFNSGVTDYDGVRVDEGGGGDLTFIARESDAQGNAGDGIDLREGGTGDLFIDGRDSSFGNNGSQPQALDSPEDGFHALERGSGSIDIRLVSSTASGNSARGILLEEEDAGDIRGSITGVEASNNGETNFSVREDADAEGGGVPGAGGISLTLTELTADDGSENGAALEEFGAGDLSVQIVDSGFSDNDADGLVVSQGGTGKGTLRLIRVTTEGNGGASVTSEGTFVSEGDDQTNVVLVRNNEDDGFGSFRAALEMANLDEGITAIDFEVFLGAIEIKSGLEYSGSQELRITGQGALVDAEDCDCAAFLISGSGDVTLDGVSIEDAEEDGIWVTGGGDLTLHNLVLRNMEGNGLFMDVDEDAEGEVAIRLENVLIENNGLHGLFVDDLAPVFGPGTGASSAAGVRLEIEQATIQGNGYRQDVTDRDGIRIDEGGLGDIDLRLTAAVIAGNAGDGLELHEEGLGAVKVDAHGSQVDANGRQPQNTDDPEDGFDIVELGPGEVRIDLVESFIRDNYARGFGLEEEGSGEVSVVFETLVVTGNDEENITITEDKDAKDDPEEGGGSLTLSFTGVTATGAGAHGLFLEEYGDGDLTGQVVDSSIRNNSGTGIEAIQAGAGAGQIQLVRVTLAANGGGNLLTDGVGVAEVPAG